MKKIIFFLLVLSFCVAAIIVLNMPQKIKYENSGSGYAILSELKDPRPFPPEALLITSLGDWRDYCDKYLIIMGPGTGSLMKNKALLIITLPSAMDYRESFNSYYTIINIKKRHNELLVYVNTNNEPKLKSSREAKTLFYVPIWINIDTVNKETQVRIIKDK